MAKNILIVDDDADIRAALAQLLEMEGYNPIVADHGKTALNLLEKDGKIDLILLDYLMPQMDGQEFLRMRESSPRLLRLPVILLSAMLKEVSSPGVTVLRKPLDVDILLEEIKARLGE